MPFCRLPCSFPQTADGQYPAPQRDLAGHSDIVPNGDIAQCRNERRAGGDTGGGAILGDRALREMDVDILILVEGVFDLVMLRDRTDVGDGSRYRFLHHIAQRAGGDGFAGTGDDRGFHLEELAAHGSPGQPIDKADAVLLGDDILGDVAGPR